MLKVDRTTDKKGSSMTNELIKIDYTNSDRPTVLARDLHTALEVETPYNKWLPRMCEYGFTEGVDYVTVDKNVYRADGKAMPQIQHDHQITIAMAKELCMLQRSEKGKQFRKYFIQVEEAWNTPEQVMARALQMANRMVDKLKKDNAYLLEKAEADAPKVLFADAVAASHTSILIGDLAKLIRQNGVEVGQNRLFQWLRDNGYLCSTGERYNLPTQKSMELKLFEVKETTISNPDGSIRITRTTKVTGKGQAYFVNKFLAS